MADLDTVVLSYEDVRRQTERGAQLVDIRTPQEFVYLHLLGAEPLAGPRFGFSVLSREKVNRHSRVIIVAATAVLGQIAAQEMDQEGIDVVGVFASLPRTWEPKGLKVQLGELVRPETFLTYLRDHPRTAIVDVREPVESHRFPFPQATHQIPFSIWPETSDTLRQDHPLIFLSGEDDRAILAARDMMVLGYPTVGYIVGGYAGFHHPRSYDPKEAARTTAHHGVFI